MLKYAKVTTVEGVSCKITYTGEQQESQMNYYIMDGYTPVIGDMVVVEDSLKLILGKIKEA